MLRVIRMASVSCWLGLFSSVTFGQLPPEILADSYLSQVEQAIRDGDSSRAWTKIQDVLRLQEDHDLDLPEFDYWYAKSADSVDLPDEALESVVRYLTVAGRGGKNYTEALKLMNKLQAQVSCKGWETEGYFKKTTIEEVSSCLATGINLEVRNDSGLTALHRAAAKTVNPAVVEALLKAGADLEAQDNNEHTPLVMAVIHNENPKVIESLLNADANPKTLEPLLEISATDLEKLERALEPVVSHMGDKDREFQYRSETLAFLNRVQSILRCKGWETEDYFRMASLKEVIACLDTGVDVRMQDGNNATALHRAAVHTADPAIIEVLIKAGSLPMRRVGDGRTALHLASEFNDNPSIIQALLNVGADVKAEDKSGNTPLHCAARSAANLAVVEVLLAAGADPLARKIRAETGQLQLGEEDSYRFVGREGQEVILDAEARGFNPNVIVKSPSGEQFYGHYLRQGKLRREILSLLLDETGEYHIRILRYDEVDKSKNKAYTLHIVQDTPLGLAIQYNDSLAVIEALLTAGDNPGWENSVGQNFLHRAARYNKDPTVIHFLLSTAGHLLKKDALGRTPLHYGAHNENPDVIKTLLAISDEPKPIDWRKWDPLHHAAAYSNNPDVIQVLLKAGADLEKKANVGDYVGDIGEKPWESIEGPRPGLYHGFRALHLAAIYNENPAVSKTLLNAGAKLKPSAGYYRDTPLRWAARYNKNPAVIQTLLEAGAELHDGNGEGMKAVHYAAMNENPEVVHALLNAGADPMARADSRKTPLHKAARFNNNPKVIEVLLNAGADLEARTYHYKYTPLHKAAASNNNPKVIETLIRAGADLAALEKHGRTPLYLANEYNENAAVHQFLLDAGAGNVEKQVAAERARRRAQSGGGGLAALVAGVTGAAIGAAGGLDAATATELGATIGGSVLAGEEGGSSEANTATGESSGNSGLTASGVPCQVPDYPNPPGGVSNLGFSWCPASVDLQVRAFALQAAGAQCAIATGSSSTLEQIEARRQEIRAACDRLAALGQGNCQCPAGLRQ